LQAEKIMEKKMTPDVLLPYQRVWLKDESKVAVWEKSRRIGASYAEALAAAMEAAKAKEAGGQSTYYLSYSKDMTRQFARDCAFWARHIDAAAREIEAFALDDDKDITVYRIAFASGHEVMCLPSTPRSLRSKQGRVVIDEAAFVDDLPELVKAAMALQMWGGCVRILSTHNGDDNPFCETVKDIRAGRLDYSLHRTTLDDALAQGLYERICLVAREPWTQGKQDAWRAKIIDDYRDAADEELFCVPARSGARYFPAALLESASDPAAVVARKSCEDSFTFEPEERRELHFSNWLRREARDALLSRKGPVYVGEDFARSGDLTTVFFAELAGKKLQTFFVIELRNVPFAQQWQTIRYCLETLPDFAAAAFDGRGNGQMIAELAAQEWPGCVHRVMATAKWYAENFPKLKGRMEDGDATIPDDPEIRDDFRAVGIKAGVPLIVERSGAVGKKRHGDAAIAMLMATFAMLEDEEAGYQPMTYEAVATANRYRGGGGKDKWHD